MVSCRRPACAGTAEPRAREVPTECIASRQPMVSRVWSRLGRGSVEAGNGPASADSPGQQASPGDSSARGFTAIERSRFTVHVGCRAGWPGVGDPAWIAPGTALAATARWARVRLGIDSCPPAERCQRPPNPVMVMPWTKKRWAKMKSTRMGASMIVLTANTISQRCTSKSLNILIPTARGNLSMVLR